MEQTAEPKRILFVVTEREINATNQRLLHLPKRFAEQGYLVDAMTYDEAAHQQLTEYYAGCPGVHARLLAHDECFWTMRQRDSFAKTFIKLFHDRIIPGTDMKFWKLVAFDDFLWNVSPVVYPHIDTHYDLVVLPVPSTFEPPAGPGDVFYTSIVYQAKREGIPILGVQIYPVMYIPPLYQRMVDHWLVGSTSQGDYLRSHGVAADRLHHIGDLRDRYSLSTVGDAYSDLVYDDALYPAPDTLAIVVVNHCRNRVQIQDMIEAIGEFQGKKKLLFAFVGYAVKELHEKDVFADLQEGVIRTAMSDDFYTVKPGSLISALMLSDVIVSSNYITPLSFASRYGKCGVVYDPLRPALPYIEDTEFVSERAELLGIFARELERKTQRKTAAQVVKEILK